MPYKLKKPRANRVFKWESKLTEEQRAFVAKMDPLLRNLARSCTPVGIRKNAAAVERSYMAGFKTLCRAAQKYDATKSAPMTYTYRFIRQSIFAYWRAKSTGQFRFEIDMMTENVAVSNGETLALSNTLPDDSREPGQIMEDAELCEKALYKVGLYKPDFEAVLRLHYGFWYERDGLTYVPHCRERSDIAEILNRSETWVKWAVCRSLELLRVCLKENN